MCGVDKMPWIKSNIDPDIIYNDGFPHLKSNDGKTYPLRVKANPDTGNFDYYWKGGGNGFNGAGIGGDVLMFQAAPQVNPGGGRITAEFIIDDPNNNFKFKDFFTGAQEKNNFNIFEKIKQEIYSKASASQREKLDKIPAYSGYKQEAPPPPDKPPGQSGDDTSDQSGSGASSSTGGSPAVFDTQKEYNEKFQTDKEYKSGFLHYPINMDPGQDRIVIVQRRYERPDVLNESGGIDLSKIIAGAFSKERFPREIPLTKILGTVVLPMPNDISETNVTAWGEDSLSSLAALVGGGALGGVSSLAQGKVPETIEEIKSVLGQILGSNTGANETVKQLLALNAAAAVTQKLGININPEAFRSRITGTAINPNLELLFQGPKLRSFGFQFKMTPRSDKEARNIRYILKFFKKGMAPKRSTTDASGSYFLGAPNVFDIYFRSSEKTSNDLKSIGKIKTCALQQCAINYTPDGFYAAFNDQKAGGSQPISVTMQLAFTELTPIYNDNYDESDENSVGFDNLENISYGEPSRQDPGGGDTSPPGPSRGGTSGPASPTRPFTPGGSTNVPGLDFNPNTPGNSPVLGPGGVRGV